MSGTILTPDVNIYQCFDINLITRINQKLKMNSEINFSIIVY